MQNYNNYLDCERLKGEQKTLHLDRGHKKTPQSHIYYKYRDCDIKKYCVVVSFSFFVQASCLFLLFGVGCYLYKYLLMLFLGVFSNSSCTISIADRRQ